MKNALKRLWNDESAQGATEYILILVAVVAVAILFRSKIGEFVEGKLGDIEGGLQQINVN